MRRLYRDKDVMKGAVQRVARYLGGQLHFQGRSKPEVEYRIRRAKQTFAVLGSFWSEVTNERWRG
eukprot:3502243-Pyramimonas_sp.AAC.1